MIRLPEAWRETCWRLGRKSLPLLSGVALAISAAWLAIGFIPWTQDLTIAPAAMVENGGQAVLAGLKPRYAPLVRFVGDKGAGPGTPVLSGLRLFENDVELGPPHSGHDTIRAEGHGRFSHWHNLIYFSASDGTDPKTNGRTYRIEAPVAPSILLSSAAAASIVLALVAHVLFGRVAEPLLGLIGAFRSALAPAFGGGVPTGAADSRIGRAMAWRDLARRFGGMLVPWLFGLAVVTSCAWLCIGFLPWTQSLTIAPASMMEDSGQAVLARLKPHYPLLVRFVGDKGAGPGTPALSGLRLFEDDVELGPPHSGHDTIRAEGHGRFSHWRQALYFSASDGTDPKTNGRTYRIEAPVAPSEFLSWAAAASILAALVGNFLSGRTPGPLLGLFGVCWSTLAPAPGFGRGVSTGLLMALSVAVGVAMSIRIWASPAPPSFAIAGWFPVSDAGGWWNCGQLLEHAGLDRHFRGADWCEWRPIYPSLVASLSLLTRGDAMALLLAQTALVSIAAGWLLSEAVRLVGWLGALTAAVLLFRYLGDFAFDQTMTENGGLAFGLLGLALLLRGAETGDRLWIALGLAGLSIALTARMGAMFALPLAALWSLVALWRRSRSAWKTIAIVGAAAAAGPLLQILLILATGGSPQNSGGNFAYTLYGLVTGGRSWMAALTDHPEFAKANLADRATIAQVYQLAGSEFRAHPGLLLDGLGKGLSAWWEFLLAQSSSSPWDQPRQVLIPAGMAALVFRWRDPRCQLLAAILLGEALSAPVVFGDAGARVVAATVATDTLIAAIGLQFVVRGVGALLRFPVATGSTGPDTIGPVGAATCLAILVMMVIAPIIRFPAVLLPADPLKPGCPDPLQAYAFDIDRAFVVQRQADGMRTDPMIGITGERIVAEQRSDAAWWAPDLQALPVNGAIVQFGTRTNDNRFQRATLIWPDAPPLHRGDHAQVCADKSQIRTFAREPYATVVSGQSGPLP
jgi:hypothetical protein